MNVTRIKDQTGVWERRIKVTSKHDGFSIIFRLREMERPAKKTVYIEHVFVDATGEIVHHHVKYPKL